MTTFDEVPTERMQARLERVTALRTALANDETLPKFLQSSIFLIGDIPGPGAPTSEGWHYTPFFSMKNSSGWLNRQLDDARIDEDKLLWLNSMFKLGVEENIELVMLAKPKAIIALGGNASKWLQKHDIKHQRSYHPQFWKRFQSKQKYPLIDLILGHISS